MSITSASAAVNTQTINSAVHLNAKANLLNKNKKANDEHTAKIDEILNAVREYKKEKSESEKAEAISKRKDKIEKYTTAGVTALTNIAKGEYIDAVTSIISLFPYGEVMSTAINFISGLCSAPDEPTYVPAVTLEDIENQLTNINNAINSMSENIKLIKNLKFTESVNEIIRIYNIAADDILTISQQKFKVAKAQENLTNAKESKDETQIKNAQVALDKEIENLANKQKKINVINEDTAILRKSIQTCTQYMMSKTLDGKNDNPFLSYLDAKLSGLKTGSSSNETIEECVKRDKKIWDFYNAGVSLYAICETNNINRLANSGDPDKKEDAEKYTRQFVKFMTGITPNMDDDGTSSKNNSNFNAADVYDYYMNEILPEEMKMADKYKFEDNTWDTKVADVTCENKTKMFKTFDDAWNYAVSYTNSSIDLYENLKINEAYSTSKKITNNITLDMNGNTIDCQNKTNAFIMNNKGKFEIKSSGNKAEFVNGYADNGGAIENLKGNLSVDNCKFVSNKAKNGGAVYTSSYNDTKLTNCDFNDNHASVDGGAVHGKDAKIEYDYRTEYCSVAIDNSTFTNNTADNNGGAVKAIYLTINNSKFTDNTTKTHGGALYSSDSIKVSGSSFENNRANGGDGGAVASRHDGRIEINNASFNNNYSYGNGGAVSSSYYTRTDIRNSTFTNNISENKGGAIYLGELQAFDHSLKNVTITGNKAKNQGGGIYANTAVAAAGDVDLNEIVIIKNNTDFNGNNSNARMIFAAAKKSKFYVQKDFNVDESDIYVSSNSNDTAVAELLKKSDENAFHADNGTVKRGNFYDKTLYFYNK